MTPAAPVAPGAVVASAASVASFPGVASTAGIPTDVGSASDDAAVNDARQLGASLWRHSLAPHLPKPKINKQKNIVNKYVLKKTNVIFTFSDITENWEP